VGVGVGVDGTGDGAEVAVVEEAGVVVLVELSRLPSRAVREMRGHCCLVKL